MQMLSAGFTRKIRTPAVFSAFQNVVTSCESGFNELSRHNVNCALVLGALQNQTSPSNLSQGLSVAALLDQSTFWI
jgi:hypothetical protein